MSGLLDGMRVLDVSIWRPVPHATQLLADLGAEVLKVEPPGGDWTRRYGPFPSGVADVDESASFHYLNARKRGVTLDLTSATGREYFDGLLKAADVLIEDCPPPDLGRFGLDNPPVERHARLVHLSLTPFGRTGPYSGWRGRDLNVWHLSGAGYAYLGDAEREPLRTGVRLGAWWAAMLGASAVLAALLSRRGAPSGSGRGQHIDLSEVETLALLLTGSGTVTTWDLGDKTNPDMAQFTRWSYKLGFYRAADGFVQIVPLEAYQFERLIEAMGHPEWAESPLFHGSLFERAPYAAEIDRFVEAWTSRLTRREVFERCVAHGVPAAMVNSVADLDADPNLEARGFFQTVETGRGARIRMMGTPYAMSETPPLPLARGPNLGADDAMLLGDHAAGDPAQLLRLHRQGIF